MLADPRAPDRALCVSQLGFNATPRADGQYPGTISAWSWIGILLTGTVTLGAVLVAVLSLVL